MLQARLQPVDFIHGACEGAMATLATRDPPWVLLRDRSHRMMPNLIDRHQSTFSHHKCFSYRCADRCNVQGTTLQEQLTGVVAVDKCTPAD